MRSLFESTPSQKSPNPKSEKSKSQIETEMRVNEAMDMVNKMDFAAFKYEESDPVKFNREEVKSLYHTKYFSPPKIGNRNKNQDPNAKSAEKLEQVDRIDSEPKKDQDKNLDQEVENMKAEEAKKEEGDLFGLKMPKLEDFGLDPNVDYDKWLGLNKYYESNPKLTDLNPPTPPSFELSPFSSDSPAVPKPEDFGIDPSNSRPSFRLSTGSESTPPISGKTNQAGPRMKPPNPKDFGIDPNISLTELLGEMPKTTGSTTRKSIGTKFIPKVESPLVRSSIQSEKPVNVFEPPKMEDFGIDPTVDISEILRVDTTPTQNPNSRPNSSLDSKSKLPTPIANATSAPNSSLLDGEEDEIDSDGETQQQPPDKPQDLPSPHDLFTPLRPVLRETQNVVPGIADGNDSFALNNVSFDKSLTMDEPGKARTLYTLNPNRWL